MADYDDITTGQLVETTAHINGWQKLRRLLVGATLLSNLSDGAQLGPAIGTYTGDGAATKAITGLGFQPRIVMLYPQADGATGTPLVVKTSSDGLNATLGGAQYEADHIISLDSGGFTVGDGTGATNGNTCNVNLRVYTYIAHR